MQNRMKKHQLNEIEIEALLNNVQVGHLAMLNSEQKPYIVPLHYIYHNNKIYFHGLAKGEKITNIKANKDVCFEICKMLNIILDNNKLVCDTNTEYNSVIINGKAAILEDLTEKEEILNLIVKKYTPQFTGQGLEKKMIKGTAVIEISIDKIAGKYYK